MTDDRRGTPVDITPSLLRGWPLPGPGEGKNTRGTVVVVGGAAETPGAVLLAGLAAMRAGAGRLSVVTTSTTAAPLGVALPEAAVYGAATSADGALTAAAADRILTACERADAVLLGPGFTDPEASSPLVEAVVQGLDGGVTLVVDAMALTVEAFTPDLVRGRSGGLVLTPNGAEARRLLDVDDLPDDAARQLADRFGAAVALSGEIVAPDGRAWRSGSGHPGLGTSGSGDVLSGAVAGLAARGCPPEQAAVWAVHLHSDAGERLAARQGRLGFLARELVDELPQVLNVLSLA